MKGEVVLRCVVWYMVAELAIASLHQYQTNYLVEFARRHVEMAGIVVHESICIIEHLMADIAGAI